MKLSKDPITITLQARDAYDAEIACILYEENVEELPVVFSRPMWIKTIRKYPVELYFIFPNKRKYNRYIKALHEERTAIKIIARF